MKPNYTALTRKYKDGFSNLDLSDLDGASHADVLKFRADVTGTDTLFANAALRSSDGGKKKKDKKDKGKRANPRYTMSTENPVGMFGDVILAKGWDLSEFRRRGQPFLFVHNIDEHRHPLGTMENVLKGASEDFVRKQPVLAGDGVFTAVGINLFNDLTRSMVESGSMPGGSVGFSVKESRAPTEKELEGDKKLRKWSAIITRASLTEFSAVPVGMDPDAIKRRGADCATSLERELLRVMESGEFDPDLVTRWRHSFLGTEPESTRTVVAVPALVFDPPNFASGGLVEGGYNDEQGSDDLNDTERASDSDDQHQSDPSSLDIGLSMEDTLRALHALGLDTTEEELREASARVTEPVSSDDDLHAENEALRSMVNEQGIDLEALEERVAFLEASLLPESASEDGGEVASRSEGDDGNPDVDDEEDTRDVYELIDDMDEAELADLVNAQ